MSENWKPGDVAMVTYGGRNHIAFVRPRIAARGELEFTYIRGYDMVSDSVVADSARRLVVIDPKDREQVERLWEAWRDLAPDHRLAQDNMQAALREFANPTPPKPEEPTGLGAVVEDAEGRKWVRIEPYGGQARWLLSQAPEHSDPRYVWSAIPAVRVLSEGVS